MIKQERGCFYVTSDGQKFFEIIEALNHEQGYAAQECQHKETMDEGIILQITANQGRKELRTVKACKSCNKVLGLAG